MKNQRATAVFYLILAGIGLGTAWYFNTAAIMGQENLLTAWFTTNADLVLAFGLAPRPEVLPLLSIGQRLCGA